MNLKRQSDPPPSASSPGSPSLASAARPLPSAGADRSTTPATPATAAPARPGTQRARLVSLDAYRGIIMIVLAAGGFGLAELALLPPSAPVWKVLDYAQWQRIGFNFEHAEWRADFKWICVPFWDLIQPAFMFIVGVAMPFSYARRLTVGDGAVTRTLHALLRSLILIALGVFLVSTSSADSGYVYSHETKFEFVNVLAQIGLGYFFVYLLLGRRFWIQVAALVVVLVGYWGWFASYTPPQPINPQLGATAETTFEGRFASWSKNANVAHLFDVWLLNQFPRPVGDPFVCNAGGYQTLNFIPAAGTMLLGVMCGQLLRSDRRWWQKLLLLVLGGAACLGLGVLAGQYACPIVKRIWTPSWVLFSGGWVIWGLALCYFLFDLCRLRWLALPITIVGMNSLAVYMMGQLLVPWTIRLAQTHFGNLIVFGLGEENLADKMFGRVVWPVVALIVFWLVALWMYRQKFFVRI